MPLEFCPQMSLQKGAKIIAIIDGVWSTAMIGFLVAGAVEVFKSLVSENGPLVIPDGLGFAVVFGLAILGVIFVAQLLVAIPLYKASNRNSGNGLWTWIIVAACSITVFALTTLGCVRDSNFTGAVLFLTFAIYKVYAVFVVVKFQISVTGGEGGVSYSATRGKHGNASVQIV